LCSPPPRFDARHHVLMRAPGGRVALCLRDQGAQAVPAGPRGHGVRPVALQGSADVLGHREGRLVRLGHWGRVAQREWAGLPRGVTLTRGAVSRGTLLEDAAVLDAGHRGNDAVQGARTRRGSSTADDVGRERLVRYCTRPPFALDRIEVL